jgi:hypothetical protein
MNETDRIEDATKNVQAEGRGLCRVLAVGVLLAVATVAGCVFTGCALLDSIDEADIEKLDALAEKWKAKLEEKIGDTVETPTPDVPPPGTPSATVDQLDYAILRWQYGGVNASGAKLDSPRLSSLSCNGRSVFYRWEVGMNGWGLSNGDAGAICAIFFERDGKWIGGKFDWVSVSRSNRELKHVESYSNWPSSGIKLPWRGRVAFVVVSADGRRRSNVLVAEAK